MSKKTIGIDARLYYQTGIGVYIQNLLFYLHELYAEQYHYTVFVLSDDYEKIAPLFPRFHVVKTSSYWHSFREQIELFYQINSQNLDLMHFTYFSYPVLYKKPFIATVHDVTPLEHRTGRASTHNTFFYTLKHVCFRYVLTQQIKNAQHIITPTKTVAHKIQVLFPQKEKKRITHTHLGIHKNLAEAKPNMTLSSRFAPHSFFLYVGNLYPHKNIPTLINALHKGKHTTPLVICTRNDVFADALRTLIQKNKQEPYIILYHDATNNDLAYFYTHAKALIHPSVSEGFGLPLIEAMHFNLPVIASNIPVFHEVLGDDYISFDPYDIDDISEKIYFFLNDPEDCTYKKRHELFSFEHMTAQTIQLYHRILHENTS